MIYVENAAGSKAPTWHVSINQWGSSGNTGYYSMAPGKKRDWDRSSKRGYVLAVSMDGHDVNFDAYYVHHNSNISLKLVSSGDPALGVVDGLVVYDGSSKLTPAYSKK